MMFKAIYLTLMTIASTASAVPKFYADFANAQGVDEDKLYAVLLAESGMSNKFGHYLPWPWSVTVAGRYYQFKTRIELFNYLKTNLQNPNITYGIAGQKLKPLSSRQLWESLSVESNLKYATDQLKLIKCKALSICVSKYREIRNGPYLPSLKLGTSLAKKQTPNVKGSAQVNEIVAKVSQQTGVDAALIHAIIARESAYKINAKSHAGAMGLMQLMPNTARYLGLKRTQYYSPYHNVLAGTRYIKEQLTNFDGDLDLALAAYNAGPGAVRKYKGIPPYKETQKYVPIVKGYYYYFKQYMG